MVLADKLTKVRREGGESERGGEGEREKEGRGGGERGGGGRKRVRKRDLRGSTHQSLLSFSSSWDAFQESQHGLRREDS